MSYKVKLNVFEGPFDLLVYLIENAQMSVYDIRISEITDQYLAYIGDMEKQVAVAAEFMVLAAALLEIKSKMLLPRAPVDDPEAAAEDPRTELVEKLLEYKRFKLLAEMLEQRQEGNSMILEKPQEDISVYTNEPDEYLSLELKQFVAAFNLFLQKRKRVEEIRQHHIRTEKQRMTTGLSMAGIEAFFKANPEKTANFKELLNNKNEKYEVALTFSSVLEMMKDGQLSAKQKWIYGDIMIKATKRLKEEAANDR